MRSNLFRVDGKVVVITGAGSGIGEAIAWAMGDAGARVALIDRDATVYSVAAKLEASGISVLPFKVDVSNRAGMRAAIDQVAQKLERIDVVFANAGIGGGPGFLDMDGARSEEGALESISDELWDRVLAVDLTAVFTTVQRVAMHMKKQSSGGRIIVTTSVASFSNTPWVGTPYLPAKAGAAHLVRQLAYELAAFNITVNAIAPGAFATNIGGGRMKSAEVALAMGKTVPLGRVAVPEDIRGLAVFLASRASALITGVEIPIDGGASIGRY